MELEKINFEVETMFDVMPVSTARNPQDKEPGSTISFATMDIEQLGGSVIAVGIVDVEGFGVTAFLDHHSAMAVMAKFVEMMTKAGFISAG